jgi:hypothetical protein
MNPQWLCYLPHWALDSFGTLRGTFIHCGALALALLEFGS